MRQPLDDMRIRRGLRNHTFGLVRIDVRTHRPRPHQGWDLYAPIGTPIYAVADGTTSGLVITGDYGKTVQLAFTHCGREYWAFYAHLSEVSVRAGQTVRAGDVLGKTGKTGNASIFSGPDLHLHFEIRVVESPPRGLAGRVDPALILGALALTNARLSTTSVDPAAQSCSAKP